MIFGLVRLIILQYSRYKVIMKRWQTISCPSMHYINFIYTSQGINNNKQSASVIFMFGRLNTSH